MKAKHGVPLLAPLLFLIACGGCVSSAPDTTGFTQVDTRVVDASFMDTWNATKAVLREDLYVIHTRDKRGVFIAYADAKRRRLTPWRTQVTVSLDAVTAESTRVTVEALRQKYGVTLLTYPRWHDVETRDNPRVSGLLDAVEQKAAQENESS